MKSTYKNCEIEVYRGEGMDGIERVYVSAVDRGNGFVVAEYWRDDRLTVYKCLAEVKTVVDEYSDNKEEWLAE